MNDHDRNRFKMIKRVSKFRTDNATLFPTATAGVDLKASSLFTIVEGAKTAVQSAIEGREGRV